MSQLLTKRLLLAFSITAVSMFLFEFLKQTLDPKVTIWQSHAVTVTFATFVATVATYFALRRYDRLNRKLYQESQERRRAEQRLKRADRRKDEFLAILAHELRGPLTPIRNAVEIMQISANDPQKMDWARNVIDRQSQQVSRLVDELLDVSRIACGKIQLQRERTDFARIVASAVEASRPGIEARNHRLIVATPDTPLPLDADVTRLTQVVLNLLNNAAKYTDCGGEIRVSAVREGGFIVLRVRDNGIGISADILPNVFDLFAQGSADSPHGGLGIGLSVVRNLVSLHGGNVQVLSPIENGRGSEFVIRLPVVETPLPANAFAEKSREPLIAVVEGGQ